jgi:hypothetical protein
MHAAAAYHGPYTRPPNEHATEHILTSSGTHTLGLRVRNEVPRSAAWRYLAVDVIPRQRGMEGKTRIDISPPREPPW